VGQADVAVVGEVFADLAGAGHEGMAVGELHLERRRRVLRHSVQDQHRTTLVVLAQQGDEFGPGAGEVHPADVDLALQLGIEFQDPEQFRATRAVIRPTLVGKVGLEEIQSVLVHKREAAGGSAAAEPRGRETRAQ